MRFICFALFFLLPVSALAQQRDSHFESYGSYQSFVDSRIANRDFIDLIQVLGGRDEYTIEQLNGVQNRFMSVYSEDFTSRAVIKKVDLGEKFYQEMRVYWREDGGYVYFYALLHDRGDTLVVLTFTLNSDVSKVLAEF
ncbi:MAG: hypothetical protein ACI8R4_001759 [Paracoccaceae bacterium]|jgi:hypothetical protein